MPTKVEKTAKSVILMAVSDPAFRSKFIADPVAAGTEMGLPEVEIEKLAKVNMKEMIDRFEGLDKFAAGIGRTDYDWSKDYSDGSNDHNKGDHDHNKNASSEIIGAEVINPVDILANNPVMLREALKDPAVRRELENNVSLRTVIGKLNR